MEINNNNQLTPTFNLLRLLQKYQNVKKELENQQQIELLRVTKNAKASNSLESGEG